MGQALSSSCATPEGGEVDVERVVRGPRPESRRSSRTGGSFEKRSRPMIFTNAFMMSKLLQMYGTCATGPPARQRVRHRCVRALAVPVDVAVEHVVLSRHDVARVQEGVLKNRHSP